MVYNVNSITLWTGGVVSNIDFSLETGLGFGQDCGRHVADTLSVLSTRHVLVLVVVTPA